MRLLFFLLCFAYFQPLIADWSRAKINRSERIVDQIIAKAAKRIESKYQLRCCGDGAAMCGGPIRYITLLFQAQGPLSQMALRKLVLACAKEVIATVDSMPEITQYLHHPPFTINDVEVSIFLRDANRHSVYDPHIATVNLMDSVLGYRYLDRQDPHGPYSKEVNETYEEALEAIKREDEQQNLKG